MHVPKLILKKMISSCLAAGILTPSILFAATLTWDGSDSNWDSAANWQMDGAASSRAPASGDTVNIASGTVASGTITMTGMTINQTGGSRVITGNDFTLCGGTTVNHTGGTLSFSNPNANDRWLNVGETPGGKAYYHLDGGELKNVKYLYVGRRGEGRMTIANSDVVANTLCIGYAVRMSGDSDVTLNSGSLTTLNESRIGGESSQIADTGVSYLGTSTMIINGGTFTNNGILNVGSFKFGTDVSGVTQKSAVKQTGGKWAANQYLYLGSGNAAGKNKNVVTIDLSGGAAVFNSDVCFGHAEGSDVAMTISDSANVTFKDFVYLGETAKTNAVLNINGGTNTFEGEIHAGCVADAVGTLNISGGVNAFNKKIIIGKAGTGNLNISADTAFTKALTVGDGGTGTMTVSGGNVNFNLNAECFYVGTNGGNGTLNISGGNISFNTGYDVMIGHSGGTGVVNQTGGTFTSAKWINIGENGTGTWNISGGQLNVNNYFGVGRRGKGILNISGTADVNAYAVFVGAFPQLSADGSELNISGGSLDGTNLYVGGNPLYAEKCQNIKSSSMTVTGGTIAFTEESFVGHHGKDGSGGNGVMNIAGGTTTFAKALNIGYGKNGSGTLNVSDGSLSAIVLLVGQAGGNGVLNISGGEIHTTGGANNFGSSGTAVVNVTGGTLTLDAITYFGRGNADASAEMYITGGTVNGPSSGDFRLGTDNAQTKLIVDGGTLNNRYNLVIDANSTGETGTLVELKSGTIKTPWFSLGQNGFGDNPHNTFNMSGGRLEVANDLRFGYNYYSDINISGGDIYVQNGVARLAHTGSGEATKAGATLNILGSASTWDLNKLEWESSGKVNFTAEKLEVNADGTAKAPVSSINVRDSAVVDSQISVDTSGFYYDGAVFLNAAPETTLFSASSLTWNPASLDVVGQWTLEKNENSINLTLDESAIGKADLSGGNITSGIFGEKSWIVLHGTPETDVDLILDVTGEGDLENLADWLNIQMADANNEISVKATDDFQLVFSNIELNEEGLAFMNYDLSAFNLANGASFEFKTNVPEPGTWILLATGMGLLFLKRKRS